MTEDEEIKDICNVLEELSEFLAKHGESNTASSIQGLTRLRSSSLPQFKATIRSIFFGGMGSFNDLVLHSSDGVPLVEENEYLDKLRSRLYGICSY